MPGHTPDHIILHYPIDNRLFLGDIFYRFADINFTWAKNVSLVICVFAFSFSDSPQSRSFQSLLALNIFLPGINSLSWRTTRLRSGRFSICSRHYLPGSELSNVWKIYSETISYVLKLYSTPPIVSSLCSSVPPKNVQIPIGCRSVEYDD